jgi:O-antigen/teichoic acid export membrane protein
VAQPGAAASDDASYARGARILSLGIASTGVFTFAYFAVASHVLEPAEYGAIAFLWSVLFVVMSVIYRPVEQLLSRTIATRRAVGSADAHSLRVPLTIQASFALLFLVVAFALRGPLEDRLESETLFFVFVGAAVAYAASYFARGYFAGHQWFALYGGLVLFESIARILFPVAVAIGLLSGQTAVALGILAAPFASLLVVPAGLVRHRRRASSVAGDAETVPLPAAPSTNDSMREGADFAASVALVQLAEQTLLNVAVLTVAASAGNALAGVVFNAFMIARAPLQLFQSIQTSLLPHLAGLEATEGTEAFARAIRVTVLAICGFAAAITLGLLVIGPFAMDLLFDEAYDYGRLGLAAVGIGMGLHLVAGTLNQAALARGHARRAAAAWLLAAAAFVAWMVVDVIDDELVRAETGYLAAAALLCTLLVGVYRRR